MQDEIDDAAYELMETVAEAINAGDYTGDDVLKALTFIMGSVVAEPPHDALTYASRLQEILRAVNASRRSHLRDAGVEEAELEITGVTSAH